MTIYSIPMTVEVIAESEEEATDLLCSIFDKMFIYGCGLSECTAQDRKPGTEVARVFDYEFKEM